MKRKFNSFIELAKEKKMTLTGIAKNSDGTIYANSDLLFTAIGEKALTNTVSTGSDGSFSFTPTVAGETWQIQQDKIVANTVISND